MKKVLYLIECFHRCIDSSMGFLEKWQTLVGSFVGVFGAALIPIAGFLYKNHLDKISERKEGLRRIEVAMTTSFQETYNIKSLLEQNITSFKAVLADIRKYIGDDKRFALDTTNFLAGEIFRDETVRNFRTDSYYLHNKLLLADTMLRSINRTVKDMKEDFQRLHSSNELMATVATPKNQKELYVQNLETFSKATEDYLHTQFPNMLKLTMQIKVYNELLRNDYEGTLKKYENKTFSFLGNIYQKSTPGLDSIDNIDEAIDSIVEKNLKTAEERANAIKKV